jgi:hypothetical protein
VKPAPTVSGLAAARAAVLAPSIRALKVRPTIGHHETSSPPPAKKSPYVSRPVETVPRRSTGPTGSGRRNEAPGQLEQQRRAARLAGCGRSSQRQQYHGHRNSHGRRSVQVRKVG